MRKREEEKMSSSPFDNLLLKSRSIPALLKSQEKLFLIKKTNYCLDNSNFLEHENEN